MIGSGDYLRREDVLLDPREAYGRVSNVFFISIVESMLVSKIKPCMSHHALLFGETAIGSRGEFN